MCPRRTRSTRLPGGGLTGDMHHALHDGDGGYDREQAHDPQQQHTPVPRAEQQRRRSQQQDPLGTPRDETVPETVAPSAICGIEEAAP